MYKKDFIMTVCLKKKLLVSLIGLTSTALFAGNPSNTLPRKIGDLTGSFGVVGCLESKGGIKNLVVHTTDTAPSSAIGYIWGYYSSPLAISEESSRGSFSFIDGLDNTLKAVEYNSTESGSYATDECSALEDDGYHNWYLPSKAELQCLGQNQEAISNTTGVSSMEGSYWSSTANSEDDSKAWLVALSGSLEDYQTLPTTDSKSEVHKVRCVRAYNPAT